MALETNIVDITANEIESYLQRSKTNSYRSLEQRSGVSKSYIYNLHKKEKDQTKLDAFKLFSVLKATSGADFTVKTLKGTELYEQLSGVLDLSLTTIQSLKSEKNIKSILKTPLHSAIYLMAQNYGGARLIDISSNFGTEGMRVVEELSTENVLNLHGGKVIAQNPDEPESITNVYTREECARIIEHLLFFYKSSNAGKSKNMISLHHQSVTPEFRNKFCMKLLELHNWVGEELRKNHNKGDCPIFFGMAMDTILEPSREKEVYQ